ncbi:amidase signature domain-containing protein [Paraphysoderma sedebokerense]|nr:amidase signature domain-containing protein [Paraphysoderma sedebokerense]
MAHRLELLSPEGLRIDGRRANELRKISTKTSVLAQADGSAYVEMGNTKVLAAVYGPREAPNRKETMHDRGIINVEYTLATFATPERKKQRKLDRKNLEIAHSIASTFEFVVQGTLYPRSQIDIHLQILQTDGGQIQACINAATLALIDAGIPMLDYVTACTVGSVEGTPILDMNHIEESTGTPEVTVAVMPRTGKVCFVTTESKLHYDYLHVVLSLAQEGCRQIHELLDKNVRKETRIRLNRSGNSSGSSRPVAGCRNTAGQLQSRSSLQLYLDKIESNADFNCFIQLTDLDEIVKESQAAERRWRGGCQKSKIDGKIIAVKDNICTKDFNTTCGSKMLDGCPSPYDATVVSLLKNAGAIIAGKTNMDEFGMGSFNSNSHFGPGFNPKIPGQQRMAGGSSGGSAAAVASEMCFAALGSDTGGSVRLPASYCGVVGLKPTYGMISRWGLVSYANSLDTVGIISNHVSDCRTLFDILAVHDHKDPTSVPSSIRSSRKDTTTSLNDAEDLSNLSIGIPIEYCPAELPPKIIRLWSDAISFLRSKGAQIRSISLPHTKEALAAYYILASAEASSNLARYDGIRYGYRAQPTPGQPTRTTDLQLTRSHGFGREVQRRILLGSYVLSASSYESYYVQAQKVRRLVQKDFAKAFGSSYFLSSELESKEKVDVILTPASLSEAPLWDEKEKTAVGGNGIEMYVNDVMNVPASLAGLPALVLPMKVTDGLPIGMQLIGQYTDEYTLFRVGEILEKLR